VASWILISGASLIDGCSVLVKDDEIVGVGANVGEGMIPRGEPVTRIDASGKTVMPGLIDAHCHTSFGEARMREEQDLYTSHELRTLRSAWNVTKVLRSGVTGISDPGGSYVIGVGIREGIAEGLIQGPRMTTAGRLLSTSNGMSDFSPRRWESPTRASARWSTPGAARRTGGAVNRITAPVGDSRRWRSLE